MTLRILVGMSVWLIAAGMPDSAWAAESAAAAIAGPAASAPPAQANAPVAHTSAGAVEGTRVGFGVMRFAGVPYAQAPVGELRFKRALAPDPWTDTRAAREHGPSCLQPRDENEPSSLRPQSEDCLWLSIWTRGLDHARRPVMVFIHGGGFWYGSSADPSYDGTQFAARGDVVLIDIEYRLGVFGWLDLDAIGGDEYADAKNLGLLDQIAALEWIRRNAENFGGDPDNVTIVGESAGSVSVGALALTPQTQGLFGKVIAQSGLPPLLRENAPFRTADVAETFSRDVWEQSGVPSVPQLQAMPAAKLLAVGARVAAAAQKKTPSAEMLMGGPVTDARLFPKPLADLLAERAASGTKFLTGTNANEFHYWLFYDEKHLRAQPKEAVHGWLAARGLSDADIDQLHARMTKDEPGRGASDVAMDAVTQAAFRNPHFVYSDIASRKGQVWLYQCEYTSSGHPAGSGSPAWGAFHAIELPFVFHNLGPESTYYAGDELPVGLADAVQDAWIAFARTGNPDTPGLPHWPRYDEKTRATMILKRHPAVENDPEAAQRIDVEAVLHGR